MVIVKVWFYIVIVSLLEICPEYVRNVRIQEIYTGLGELPSFFIGNRLQHRNSYNIGLWLLVV